MVFQKIKKDKAGQVWIETAIYTLIGLTIIAIVLTTATPQIEKLKDRGILSQTMEALAGLDSKISEVEQAPSSSRVIPFVLSKGQLKINANDNIIQYVLEDTRLELTEVNETLREGDIYILTKQRGSRFDVFLTMNYSDKLNMTFNNQEKTEVLQASSSPYQIIIENVGDNSPMADTHVDFNLL